MENEPDFLDEDPVINSQKYFILSYILPKNSKDQPLIKVRGSFSCVEDCEKRIKKLQVIDNYFNLYIAEVGKWGSLLTEPQLKSEDIDTVYNNKHMNELVRGYKENKDKADMAYVERTRALKDKAQKEGTKEGQKDLSTKEENPIIVKNRLSGVEQNIAILHKELEELQIQKEKSLELLNSFSDEKIKEAEKEFEEFQKNHKTNLTS